MGIKTESSERRITVRSVSKKLKGITLLSDISCTVVDGECFGILGQNGSGKTLLLRILTGLVTPSSGDVSIIGKNPHAEPEEALAFTSAMVGIPAFYDHISAFNNLRLFVDSDKVPSNEKVISTLDEVGLADERNKKVEAFSRGMLQRLGIALTLLEHRPFVILDEPTQGVDDVWIEKLVDIFKSRFKMGQSFIITSHDFDFVMELCSNVMILDAGRQIYLGPLKEVAEFSYYFQLRCDPESEGLAIIANLDYVHKVVKGDRVLELTLSKKRAWDLLKILVDSGCKVHELSLKHYSISNLLSQRYHESINE